MSKKAKTRIQRAVSIATTFTTVMWMSGVAMLAPMAAKAVTLSEGDLIRGPDGIKVYIINDKSYKRHIFNPAVFDLYGHLKWENIKSVDQATLDSYTTSDIYRADGDTKVYQTGNDGIKHWFDMTAAEFVSEGYNWDQVFVVNGTERDYYTTGSSIGVGGGVPAPATAGLTVALDSDTPAAAMVAENTVRNLFTKINLSAGSDADVVIAKLTVERTGQAQDAAFDSLVLLDAADMTQIGLAQSLNAVHKAVFDSAITIAKGTTKSIYLAANMVAALDNYAGELPKLSLIAIETTANITGSLPMTGNAMTLNGTLTTGSVTATRGSLDPGAAANKEVGTTAYNFASIKLTAGAVENVTVEQLRFNQAGSAASSDLGNVKVKVDGTEYDTTVSSDGKYYNAVLGSGLLIAKGLSQEFTIKGDILGGSGRTIDFNLYNRKTDIVAKGNLYSYHLPISGGSAGTASAGSFSSDTNPFYNAYAVTIQRGSLRVDKSLSVSASNVSEGSTGVTIGALDFVVQGEPIRVSDMYLDIDLEGTGQAADLTNITVYDSSGTALLGPLNGANSTSYGDGDAGDGFVRYQSALIIPVGTNTYTVKADLNTDFASDDTLRIGMGTQSSATGPASRIATATGTVTGEAITATPTSAIWSNTQTIKAGALHVNVSSVPTAQTVVRGINGFEFARFVFDGSNSGEDLRITSMEIQETLSAVGVGDETSNLVLYDGATALNTGSNVVNPTDPASSPRILAFTLDNVLTIPKQSTKIISLKGNISGSATDASSHTFGLSATASDAEINVTGVSTGASITETYSSSAGQAMTVATSGAFAVELDAGTHTGKLAYAGMSDVEMSRLKFIATSEPISLTNLRLKLGSASTSVNDLVLIKLYDGGTQISSAVATSTTQIDFVIASGDFIIPKDSYKILTVKADLANIGTGQPGGSGHWLALDYRGADRTQTYGYGQSSGAKITSDTISNTAQTAVRLFKGIPKLERVALGSNKLSNSSSLALYKIKVTAQGDQIDLYKFTFIVSTTSVTVGANIDVVDVTETAEQTLFSSTTLGAFVANTQWDFVLRAHPGTTATAAPKTVAVATPRTFELRAAISSAGTNSSLSARLEGDADSFPTALIDAAATIDGGTDNDFIWSDHSSTTNHSITSDDWANAYLVEGLPSSNMTPEVLSY